MLRLRCAYSQIAPDIRRRGSSRPSPMCGGSSAGSQSRVEPTYVRFNISQTSTGVTAWSRHGKLCIATQLAQRAGISRMTLSAVEAAEPTPTMGRYLRVMGALGVSGDLVLLASDALEPPAAADPAGQARKELRVSASSAKRELQDLQGLMLPKEAVRRMQKQPALIQRALDTLEEWRQAEDRTLDSFGTSGRSSCTAGPGAERFRIQSAQRSFGRRRPRPPSCPRKSASASSTRCRTCRRVSFWARRPRGNTAAPGAWMSGTRGAGALRPRANVAGRRTAFRNPGAPV